MPAQSSPYAKNAVLVALGTTIRRVRRARHISQERLALETEIDRSYLGAIERGEQNVGIMHLWRICSALGVTMSDLMNQAGL